MKRMPQLEVIVLDAADARAAAAAGVDRIEVVSAIDVGGLTPTADVLAGIVAACTVPAMVMVRPHERSFVYGDADMREVREAIAMVRDIGGHGIVFGALTERGEVDERRLAQVIAWADPLPITFHRAFDAAVDLDAAYAVLERHAGAVAQVLTSGGRPTATDGRDALARLLQRHGTVDVLVGSGVHGGTIGALHALLAARQYHVGSGARTDGRYDAPIDAQRIAAVRAGLDGAAASQPRK